MDNLGVPDHIGESALQELSDAPVLAINEVSHTR